MLKIPQSYEWGIYFVERLRFFASLSQLSFITRAICIVRYSSSLSPA